MKTKILLNAIRNAMTFFGVFGTAGYFAGSKALPCVLGVFFLTGSVFACYWFECRFRELRLRHGWYL